MPAPVEWADFQEAAVIAGVAFRDIWFKEDHGRDLVE